MRKGVVNFIRPEDCPVKRSVKNYAFNKPKISCEREKYEEEELNELDNIIK